MAKITAICRNEDCTMFNQPQEVEKSEMVCPECGEPMIAFEGGGGTNWFKEQGKQVGIAAAAVVLLGGGGFGAWKALQGGEASDEGFEPPVKHSTSIASITVEEGWTVEDVLTNDTIWIKANDDIDKNVQDAGVTPLITLSDSTSTFSISPATVTDCANVQVQTVDGQSASHVIALKKKVFGKEPVEPSTPPKRPVADGNAKLYRVSYATFDGTTLLFKSAHLIPGTSQMAQPGDKVTGVWADGEVNSVRWYHADGSPSEVLTHE